MPLVIMMDNNPWRDENLTLVELRHVLSSIPGSFMDLL
jgi:hypothetical protein